MTRPLRSDEKRVRDVIARYPDGCTRALLEFKLPMTHQEIANAIRRLARHGYVRTGWPVKSKTLWFTCLPSEVKR